MDGFGFGNVIFMGREGQFNYKIFLDRLLAFLYILNNKFLTLQCFSKDLFFILTKVVYECMTKHMYYQKEISPSFTCFLLFEV